MKKIIISSILLFIFSFIISAQKFDNVANTPPMGWNSWNRFGCDVSEELIINMADAMVSSGMKDAGYEYIVIDDCWQIDRDENGEIVEDPDRFPNGMKHLVDYVHSKGLKFGIYSDGGTKTCQGRPGSRGYEFQDARTYAKWGVDYLKYDFCYASTQNAPASFSIMRDALYEAGRPIVFSICEGGNTKPWEWGKDVGHLWRTTPDIVDDWDALLDILDLQRDLYSYAGPGHWNDPDMLQIGNGRMTFDEYKTHFTLWCMMAAPLMAGNDLTNMTPEILELLTNKEVIAIDQDSLGKQAFCYRTTGDYEVWVKELMNNEKAFCLLNRSDEEKEVKVNFSIFLNALDSFTHLKADYYGPIKGNKLKDYKIRDLWEQKDLEHTKDIFVKIPPHSVKLYRFVVK